MAMRFAAVIIAASLCACSNDHRSVGATPTTPTSPAPPGRVQGVVLDFQTAKPIPGAVVGFSKSPVVGFSEVIESTVTDADGRYSLPEPPARGVNEPYGFVVDNQYLGRGYPRSRNYRGDVAVDRGKCVARYGMVLDSRTYAPIVGATALDLGNQVRATTDKDGWYRIDWGCGVGYVGFNTTWHIMSHPNYNSRNFAGGRGIIGTFREDVMLDRK